MSETKLVKGRKDYKCTYCGRSIKKGLMHFTVTITPWCHPDNDSFANWRIHSECKDLGDEFYYEKYDKGIYPHDDLHLEFKKALNEKKKSMPASD